MKTVSAREANQNFSSPEQDAERAAAHERLMKLLLKGVNLGGIRVNRDEIHDR